MGHDAAVENGAVDGGGEARCLGDLPGVAAPPSERAWLHADLKAWACDPCPRRAAALRARFDDILGRRTGCATLDRLLARLHRRKSELVRVLQHPEIPLHTNGSENDIQACVTKRKISGGTMSTAGRTARDVTLDLMKTCSKLGVSFFLYLGDQLHVPGAITVPPHPDLVRQAATTACLPGNLPRLWISTMNGSSTVAELAPTILGELMP